MTAEMALPDKSDEDLMLCIASGQHEDFQELARRYTKLLYSVAYRMVSQKADAEDIVQESLLRIWSKAHLWKPNSGAAVSTWIYRIAYNLCIDQKRKQKIKMAPLDDNEMDMTQRTDRKLEAKQVGKIVGQAIKALPERQKAALLLCHHQGMSNADAAQIMGTSVKAVEGLLVRARQALRADLTKYEGVL